MQLTFQFDSLADFFYMAGHGPYVWVCYGIGLLCLLYLAVSPLRSRKALLAELRRAQRIEAHEQKLRQQAAVTK